MEKNNKREYYENEITSCLIKMKDTIKEAYENLTASDYDKFYKICDEKVSEILSEIQQIIH